MDRDDTILDYLQNRLGPKDRDRFERDMAQDASLAAEVDLMRSVRAELATGPKHENADAVWARVSASMDSAAPPANVNRPPWMQFLRYATVATIAITAWQLTVAPRISNEPNGFRAASERAAAVVLQVKFAPTATIGDIGTLLAPLRGTITEGPSALGLVRVSFPDEAARQQAIVVLNGRPDLVELAVEQ